MLEQHPDRFRLTRIATRATGGADLLNCRIFPRATPLRETASPVVPAAYAPQTLPIVVFPNEDQWSIVDGHRRMSAAFAAGIESIDAVALDKATPRRDIAKHAIEGRRHLTGMETATLLDRVLRFSPLDDAGDEVLAAIEATLGLRVTRRYVHRLRTAVEFDFDEQVLLHSLRAAPDVILALMDLSRSERRALLVLRARVAMTVSELKGLVRIIVLLRGRAAAGGFDLAEWAHEMAKQATGLTAATIVDHVRAISHPTLRAREQRVRDLISAVSLPSTASLAPPDSLEGTSVSCYFRFSSEVEFREHIDKLQRAASDGVIAKIIDEIGG